MNKNDIIKLLSDDSIFKTVLQSLLSILAGVITAILSFKIKDRMTVKKDNHKRLNELCGIYKVQAIELHRDCAKRIKNAVGTQGINMAHSENSSSVSTFLTKIENDVELYRLMKFFSVDDISLNSRLEDDDDVYSTCDKILNYFKDIEKLSA
ncbi:hypothetical protein [Leuconostoc mesenteroides]|uniref:hypothetical protein n=1 Tax=Leuconostoc mesenteroides TaxID=1245 RepID=UPI0007512192|nr:hypothetical protein [Leuconostoc mesenteroides]